MPLLFAATHLPGWRDRDGLQIAITALIGISLISAVVLGMISLFDHGYRWRLGVYGLLISAADFCALILINLTMTA
ncbi:MAG TPA: hypothetical protein VG269_17285 [Tepidisphaeraceae bacterium]|nr:hypothetical protein [Tepidisphaeraceae bacterium]